MIDRLIQRFPRWARTPAEILAAAANEYGLDRASRMSAAIAYRTVFAFAPLLIIGVAVLGAFLGSDLEAQQEIIGAIEEFAGPEVAQVVASVLDSALDSVDTAAVIGGLLLLWTASSLFLELQHDLNDVFGVPYERVRGPLATVRSRGVGFLWAFGLGIILIAIWLLNALWRFLGGLLPPSMSNVHEVVGFLTPVVSLALLPVLFGLVFQTMTAVTLNWRAVWVGGAFTAAVFVAASYGIGFYFEIFDSPSALGFAGSFVLIIFLAYFLSAVFLFGAEVTKVYARRLEQGSEVAPTPAASPDPLVVVAQPGDSLPQAAFLAFLAGLLVGWRRRR
ncbi:MAG TPA: YihY/virulence factor BrkB family protein [Acidimicrobiia bacterium]|nr:YihY/virulence factor BrkB family protein [Acidimicrobiia bacterium]